MRNPEDAVHCFRAVLVMVAAGLLAGCSFLPIALQSRNVAVHLGLSNDEIAVVVRQASAAHRLEAHWIRKVADDAIEIGLGMNATTLSVVFRRVDGRWGEVPGSRRTWSPVSDLPTPPALLSY